MAAKPERFALAFLAGRDLQEIFKDLLAHFFQTQSVIKNLTTVDVHIFFHTLEHRRVGGKFQAWYRLATVDGSPSGGEAGDTDFMISCSETTCLGFSMLGASIPAGNGVLVELDGDIADSENSIILDQVLNGVAVRMSILYCLLGNEKEFKNEKK